VKGELLESIEIVDLVETKLEQGFQRFAETKLSSIVNMSKR